MRGADEHTLYKILLLGLVSRYALATAVLRAVFGDRLEVDKLNEELNSLENQIADFKDILAHESRVLEIITRLSYYQTAQNVCALFGFIQIILSTADNYFLLMISDIREESDRDGMRIVVEVKKDANAQVVLNLLYKHTNLQVSDGIIMLALVDGFLQALPY